MSSRRAQEHLGFICKSELRHACKQLSARWQSANPHDVNLAFRGSREDEYLSITRPLSSPIPESYNERAVETALDVEKDRVEDSDEAAIHHHPTLPPAVEYTIIHSPSYRVPVLYFSLLDIPSDSPGGVDAVYDLLVPKHQHEALRAVGVLGGIGMINHPITDLPCFWVHPCNTAEAMAAMMGSMGREYSGFEYLMLWIGLVGSAVGLRLPKELAIAEAI